MIREFERKGLPGLAMLLVFLAVGAPSFFLAIRSLRAHQPLTAVGFFLLDALCVLGALGVFVVNPNESRVLQLFGAYRGTVRTTGLRWANPFYTKQHISQRVRNFESARLKVNDSDGNPIEIAAVVVWRVVDSAEAVFEVENYENYVKVQSEAALRNLATRYPYDAHQEHETSLRGSTTLVAGELKKEVQERLSKAGVEVMEARISHLAYASEIAAAMLRRQQAGAIIAARQMIVEGAVGMVEMALEKLAQSAQVTLDEERKAAMVSNLLVVLCADREAQPVVNTGTLYQ
ncbi:MAG TPA: SPFH domain-containing protein [Vicinamibacteria bacterium]|nr:SPFH domain-containing protein [Vicinamibacteria bacterium]